MKLARVAAQLALLLVLGAAIFSDRITSHSYEQQLREATNAPMSREFPLGTDSLGRDRLARLLYGTRISLLLAPAAALLATLLAALVGGLAGYLGGWCDRLAGRAIDLTLSLPWLFLLITVRALLPLNVSPLTSILITFALLGLLGWASPARVVRAGVRRMRDADFLLHARACGCRPWRLFLVHLLPNLKPVLLAQFWTSIPIFILSEANLGMLGLGVAEPLPSWGNLLRDLENQLSLHPGVLAVLALLILVMGCFRAILPAEPLPAGPSTARAAQKFSIRWPRRTNLGTRKDLHS